jgi:hypothetical protein
MLLLFVVRDVCVTQTAANLIENLALAWSSTNPLLPQQLGEGFLHPHLLEARRLDVVSMATRHSQRSDFISF